ncbi:MAG: helix-turn-helix domain-containing protein [Alphaproteobacteria bacterium]
MDENLPVDELENLANEDVGEALRRTRRFYNKSLEDVEGALRIRASQIDAIERGDMRSLPGRVYAIGFVRSYAEYLGIDGNKVVQLFKAQYMDNNYKADLTFKAHASEAKTPALWLATFFFLIAAVGYVVWHEYQKPDRGGVMQAESVPDDIRDHVNLEILKPSLAVPEIVQDVDVQDVESVVENMSNDEPQKAGIILNIIDDCWVEIKNGEGKVIVSNILETGEQYFVPDSPGLSMSLGNAANVEILVDGRALKPLGGDGDVRRDIPLNTVYLKTLEFQEIEPPEDDSDAVVPPEE